MDKFRASADGLQDLAFGYRNFPNFSRFMVGVVTDVEGETGVGGSSKKDDNYKLIKGKVRVKFSSFAGFDSGVSVWLPPIRRFAHKGDKGAYGFATVPQVGVKVLVAFIGSNYTTGVILGALMDSLHKPNYEFMKGNLADAKEFAQNSVSYINKGVGITVTSKALDDDETKFEDCVYFYNIENTGDDANDNNKKKIFPFLTLCFNQDKEEQNMVRISSNEKDGEINFDCAGKIDFQVEKKN